MRRLYLLTCDGRFINATIRNGGEEFIRCGLVVASGSNVNNARIRYSFLGG